MIDKSGGKIKKKIPGLSLESALIIKDIDKKEERTKKTKMYHETLN